MILLWRHENHDQNHDLNVEGTGNRDQQSMAQNEAIWKSILLENVMCCLDDIEDVKFDWIEQKTQIKRWKRTQWEYRKRSSCDFWALESDIRWGSQVFFPFWELKDWKGEMAGILAWLANWLVFPLEVTQRGGESSEVDCTQSQSTRVTLLLYVYSFHQHSANHAGGYLIT